MKKHKKNIDLRQHVPFKSDNEPTQIKIGLVNYRWFSPCKEPAPKKNPKLFNSKPYLPQIRVHTPIWNTPNLNSP